MQYMGGKTRIAKQIAAEIDKVRKPGQLVWDAFCGGLSVSVTLSKNGPVLASDACLPLISLYKAVQDGWDPPTEVSKETWQAAKLLPDTDPMKAFCGFGCSYGGLWFSSYARNRPITRKTGESAGYAKPATTSRNLILRRTNTVKNIDHIDFINVVPTTSYPIIYCDIPYENTEPYPGTNEFNRSEFMVKINEWSKYSHIFISEYNFPHGNVVWSTELDCRLNVRSHGKARKTVERLYHIPKGSL